MNVGLGDTLGASRVLGALLCIVCVVIAALHILVGYFGFLGGARAPLAFAIPVTVGLLVVMALGFWLGWIMATTKEAPPSPPPSPEPEAKPEEAKPETEGKEEERPE